MCLAISKPMGKKVPKSHLENGFANNSDGAGFAIALPDKTLHIEKGFFTFETFYKAYEQYEELPALIHFRIGTSGKKDTDNCHPWRINERMALIHNGILPMEVKGDKSDTGLFTHHVMAPIIDGTTKNGMPDWWKSQSFRWMMEELLGTGNKVCIMDNLGEVVILKERMGQWEGGVWYSNGGFRYGKGGCHISYSGHFRGEFHEQDYMPSRNYSATTTPVSQANKWKETSIAGVYVLHKEFADRWKPVAVKAEVKDATAANEKVVALLDLTTTKEDDVAEAPTGRIHVE